jgi:putative pre-16S rRNA nuclease
MGPFARAAAKASPAAAPKRVRILALDYGRRRIGLAISDELGLTANPLPVLLRKNRREDLARLREIANANSVARIIVGLPLHLSGRHGEMAEEASRFASRLAKELGLPVEQLDERLTSWEAEQLAKESQHAKKADLDSVSAAILLREYLETKDVRSESAGAAQTP